MAARAKCCNLIGNLCRHSARFYTSLAAPVGNSMILLDLLIASCTDHDSNVRKFACFAVGNAAFHSDELYAMLRRSVAGLRAALHDPEEKTRSNAAGALGNLCRNSGELGFTISEENVIAELIQMVISDSAETCQVCSVFSLP